MNRTKLIYKWYLISAIIISSILLLVLIHYLIFDVGSGSYMVISIWSPIASFWLTFNLIIIALVLFKQVKNFRILLPSLFILGEIFSAIVIQILAFVELRTGAPPLSMSSGALSTVLNMIFPIITLVVAIISLSSFKKKN